MSTPDPFLDDATWARVAGPLAEAWTLPPAAYTDPEVSTRELDSIFRHDWICVARSSQLPTPGDYVAVDLIDQPVLVIRQDDGTLRAMSNVCLHRFMLMLRWNLRLAPWWTSRRVWRAKLQSCHSRRLRATASPPPGRWWPSWASWLLRPWLRG